MKNKKQDLHSIGDRINSLREKNTYKCVDRLDQYLSLQLDNTDGTHHYRHLHNAKKIKAFDEDRNLLELDKDKVMEILTEIERSSYATKSKDYSKGTKNKYRKTLDYLLKMQDLYWDDLTPRGMNIYQKTDDREKTDKDELLDPGELNQFLEALDSVCKSKYVLRNEAFFYTLWNTGARVGGVRNIKVEDVKVDKQVVEVTVPAWKDSPRRKDLPLYFAAPVLKRYLKTIPDDQEFLFTNREGNTIGYQGLRKTTVNTWNYLDEKVDGFNVKYEGQPLHVFRKSFKTYSAIMELLGPDESDIWTGHALGSTQIKQIYDRRDTDSAGNKMRSALGLETDDKVDWKQRIAPQSCKDCGQQNSSHRSVCFSCGGVLKPEELPGGLDSKDSVDIDLSSKIGARLARNEDKSLKEVRREVMNERED